MEINFDVLGFEFPWWQKVLKSHKQNCSMFLLDISKTVLGWLFDLEDLLMVHSQLPTHLYKILFFVFVCIITVFL